MLSKILKTGLLLFFVMQSLQAQITPTVDVSSTIEAVTVYQKNARIVRKAKANIPAGKSELLLKQLSPKILINSIQVKLSNKNITLIAAVPRANYLEETVVSERYLIVKDSLDLIEFQLKKWEIKERVLLSTKKTMMDNNPLKSTTEETYSIADVKKLMDFRQKELSLIETELLTISYEKIALIKQQQLLQKQLVYLASAKEKPTGELVLQVQSTGAVSTNIEVEYVVTNAKWTPLYDLKSEGIDQPLALTYKAHVSQSTGIDWKQVKVNLSSSDPSLSHDRPILNPLSLDITSIRPQTKRKKGNTYIQYQGSGNVVLEKQLPQRKRDVSSIATTTAGISLLDEGEAINSTGSRSSSNDAYIDGVRVVGKFGVPEPEIVSLLTENGDNTIEFELELLQDIPSDGEKHIVEISENELNVNYEYHLVPKMDKGAFLLAKISNYGQYNLLNGPANIFFDGVYLGQSYINASVTTDTLLLSLGRDEKISVSRERVKSLKKEAGAFVKENIQFEISIRNNKSKAIEITLLDQIPLSKNKDLEIKLLESSSAVHNKSYGSLRWVRSIQPNETTKILFEYEAKYPKGKGVYKAR